jgi:hypothetical protein
MNTFDVRIYPIRRRKSRRRPFEVRWRVAGRDKSKSFITRQLADSYRCYGAVNPQTVANPAQVQAILAEVSRIRPDLAAFFGCLYYAALRPEEAWQCAAATGSCGRMGGGS